MRGINFLAGLGTILVFTGIVVFKVALQHETNTGKRKLAKIVSVSNYRKAILFIIAIVCMIAGLLLIAKSMKLL
jgi:hypothetical protein